MAKQTIQTKYSDETDIDITPMLDVVFIMLIFFIVTASFVRETGFGLNVPTTNHTESPGVAPIIVEINDHDEVHIQRQLVLASSIKPTITRLRAENPSAAVVVHVHPQTATKALVSTIDHLRAARVELPAVSMLGS